MSQSRRQSTRRSLGLGAATSATALIVLSVACLFLAPRLPLARAMSPHAPAARPHANVAVPFSPIAHDHAGAGMIVRNGQAPLPAFQYHIENHWYEVKNGLTIIVYAGVHTQDPDQGVVIVEIASPDYTRVNGPFVFNTARRDGSVHVVAASGERLTLATAHGVSAIFDVANRAFVKSLSQ